MACKICGSYQLDVFCTIAEFLQKQGSSEKYFDNLFDAFYKCKLCASVFVWPEPPAEVLDTFYTSYSGTFSYEGKYYRKMFRAIKRVHQLKKFTPGKRFLDIGCNMGYAVEAARWSGFQATGIDVDKIAIAKANKRFPQNLFSTASVESLAAVGLKYDAIYCAEVIEHVPSVEVFLKALGHISNPDAVLYLTTPELIPMSKDQFLEWDEVRPPEHLQWFTRKGIIMALRSAGFEVHKFIFSFKPGIKLIARRA